MFTGIVEETGEVVRREETEGGLRLRVQASFADELEVGQSVAVSGACLTVEDFDSETFELFLSRETVEKTYLGEVAVGDVVNLERALPADGRFDGHFVQGHVDGTAEVVDVEQVGDVPASEASGGSSYERSEYDGDWTFTFSLPESMGRYVVPKGSICVDGISLTVADLRDGEFDVAIIPETYRLTNLAAKAAGDPVHLEVDVVAKYVESLTEGYR
ncbi:riboflavin synthase [Salinirubellus salinus]|uniref:Riboflavin synthase n=1 Tax=Salinirubellus salinus TaxID=1364945 RepID=A0A9E7R0R6_9EURY|nr:riboflavin synthase [Salinirubellus salinus]UWM53184.1 riboflavin synthase [Salinirubellus salinus]